MLTRGASCVPARKLGITSASDNSGGAALKNSAANSSKEGNGRHCNKPSSETIRTARIQPTFAATHPPDHMT